MKLSSFLILPFSFKRVFYDRVYELSYVCEYKVGPS